MGFLRGYVQIVWVVVVFCAAPAFSASAVPLSSDKFGISKVIVGSSHLLVGEGSLTVGFSTSVPTRAWMFFYAQDMTIASQVVSDDFRKAHRFEWDGRDSEGDAVDTQIVIYRIEMEDEEGLKLGWDPHLLTGGRNATIFWPRWHPDQQRITFNLHQDCLVRIRVGLKDGPLIATVADWVPVSKYSAFVRWDGWDASRSKDYSDAPNLEIFAEAITLPKNYIHIVNPDTEEPVYSTAAWIRDAVAVFGEDRAQGCGLASGIVGTVPESAAVTLKASAPLLDDGTLELEDVQTVTVHVPELTEDQMANQAYEVLYFMDGRFLKEDMIEDGPVTLELDPEEIEKGDHTLIFNVILGSSRVGTRSLRIRVP